ncbi:4Fe-4S binding protein [candidate division KSB1 bacterium]|nr:4Fe-4S binding protein [candidate division KSB1 bacterium]
MNYNSDNGRRILQWAVLAVISFLLIRTWIDDQFLVDFEAYCPFGGMQALSSFWVSGSLACTMTSTQIFMGLALIAGVVLMSKLFCSHVCPLGTITEWLGKLGRKLKASLTLKGWPDRLLRSLKYLLLFLVFYFSVSSSELFCKTFDPYYALTSGFGHDVVLKYALPAIGLMIIGSVFIRQFWCKYLCPLGAATNIFGNAIWMLPVIVLFLLLNLLGWGVSWIWLLAGIVITGAILEISRMRFDILPPIKITRVTNSCNDCKRCDRVCPMDIPVSKSETIHHIDCHLCNRCISACHERNSLQLNHKTPRWTPVALTLLLAVVGLAFASKVELPTIQELWASEDQLQRAEIYSQSGLKNVKCYGSSMAFASQMRQVEGVLGVKTYVGSNTVEVYYDSQKVDTHELRQAMFQPMQLFFTAPADPKEPIIVTSMKIERFFDTFDGYYLSQLMQQQSGIYGLETVYGEPVLVKIYHDPELSSEVLVRLASKKQVSYTSGGQQYTQKIDFQVKDDPEREAQISRNVLIQRLFRATHQILRPEQDINNIPYRVYEIEMPQAGQSQSQRAISFLISHLSQYQGVISFKTMFTDRPVARIGFNSERVTSEQLLQWLRSESLTVQFRDGSVRQIPNSLEFPHAGQIIENPSLAKAEVSS